MTNQAVRNGIRGVSERRRIPRVGKIHLGIRVPNKNGRGGHPEAVDYFVVPEALRAVLGEKPTSLNITFHSDDPNDFARQNLLRYTNSGLTCRGDGYRANALVNMPVYAQWTESTGGD